MADDPKSMAVLDDWRGMMSSASPHKLPPGAMTNLENAVCNVPGELRGRKGMRPVTLLGGNADTGDVIAMTRFNRPEAEWIVYLTTSGEMRAGRGAS